MFFLKLVLCFFTLIAYINCQSNEEIQFYVNLITENILKTQEYVAPTSYEGFQRINDYPIDFGNYDFIIVGGGTAGSLLANRLSEVKEWSVLVIEGGGRGNAFNEIPGVWNYLYSSGFNWGFRTTPQKTCKSSVNASCNYPRGKGLGGSSLINGNIYAHGSPDDFNQWAAQGLEGWSFEEILHFIKKHENATLLENIDTHYHGFDGEVNMENQKHLSKVASTYIKCLDDLGISMTDYNGPNTEGYGLFQYAIKNGRKMSGDKAFINPIEKYRSNLKILTHSLATKLIIEDSVVKGVEFIHDNITYIASASKELILSAGVIGSAQLLMLSGVGPSEDLENLNITVKKDLPVGKFFKDHFVMSFQASTNISRSITLEDAVADYLQGFFFISKVRLFLRAKRTLFYLIEMVILLW